MARFEIKLPASASERRDAPRGGTPIFCSAPALRSATLLPHESHSHRDRAASQRDAAQPGGAIDKFGRPAALAGIFAQDLQAAHLWRGAEERADRCRGAGRGAGEAGYHRGEGTSRSDTSATQGSISRGGCCTSRAGASPINFASARPRRRRARRAAAAGARRRRSSVCPIERTSEPRGTANGSSTSSTRRCSA